jgi:hypothetical protein
MTDLKNFKGTVMELLGIEHREMLFCGSDQKE